MNPETDGMAKQEKITAAPDVRQGAVVSDLHLFTNRTTVNHYVQDIHDAARECALIVLNGDIFDFHWSRYKGSEASVRAAEAWIRDLAGAYADTRFVFILGNHDSIRAYRELLEVLSRELSNVEWRPEWYRIDGKLFLHGDVYHGGASSRTLWNYRRYCNRLRPRTRFHHAAYWAFYQSRLPFVLLRFVNRKTCARRILAYLSREFGSGLADIREIYFGHVHTPFTDFRYNGIIFHNSGAATKGGRLAVMRFALPSDTMVMSHYVKER
jgi:UDP-2,3-diacylglucosamine hydrolase